MNLKNHAICGGLVSGAFYLFYKLYKNQEINFWEMLAVGAVGAAVAVLPDVIEPATNPNHRSVFHSGTTLGLIALGNNKILQTEQLTENQKAWLLSLGLAYSSHLVLDGTTPKSIPLLI
ncbi:MAG: metal-dependent hydrolase [Candidatus Bathyarchaeota archaeon]|nr:metal-dependent hydrolase [Candidatus Bathyarchaeota archaeon]